eukprot:jgi/Tetstr1/459235/TSEL_000044.t2
MAVVGMRGVILPRLTERASQEGELEDSYPAAEPRGFQAAGASGAVGGMPAEPARSSAPAPSSGPALHRATTAGRSMRLQRRQIYWLRLTLGLVGLPRRIFQSGVFCRVQLVSEELGAELSGRQAITELQYVPSPQFATEQFPLCFCVGDSEEVPASSSIILVEIFTVKTVLSLWMCRTQRQPIPGGAGQGGTRPVRVQLKDVLHGGKLVKKFVSPMQLLMKSGARLKLGELQAEVIMSGPRNGRCLMGISPTHKVYDHAQDVCYVLDTLQETTDKDGKPQEGFVVRSAVKSGKMGLKRSVGPVEARVLFRPDGSSCVQLATPLYDGFTDWATLTHNPAARSPARRFHITCQVQASSGALEACSITPLNRKDSLDSPIMWGSSRTPNFMEWVLEQNISEATDASTSGGDAGGPESVLYASQWSLTVPLAPTPKPEKPKGLIQKSSMKAPLPALMRIPSAKEDPQPKEDGAEDRNRSADDAGRKCERSRPSDDLPQPSTVFESHISQGSAEGDGEAPPEAAGSADAAHGIAGRLSRTISSTSTRLLKQIRSIGEDRPSDPKLNHLLSRAAMAKQVHWTVADFKAMPFKDPGLTPGRQLIAQIHHGHVDDVEAEQLPVWTDKPQHGLPYAAEEAEEDPDNLSFGSSAFASRMEHMPLCVAVEYDVEQQGIAPALIALAAEMQRRSVLERPAAQRS